MYPQKPLNSTPDVANSFLGESRVNLLCFQMLFSKQSYHSSALVSGKAPSENTETSHCELACFFLPTLDCACVMLLCITVF